jgi:hypothetical protein
MPMTLIWFVLYILWGLKENAWTFGKILIHGLVKISNGVLKVITGGMVGYIPIGLLN